MNHPPNFANRTIYHADNLPVLKGMNSGSVHLIATDPPFNKNRDFHATPESIAKGAKFQDRWSWDRDVHEEWMDEMHEYWPGAWGVIQAARLSYGDDMGAYLCWLGVRLMEMHRVLRDDGSIYLHVDDTAHAYAKALMDAIFGIRNFKNEIVWERSAGRSDTASYARIHDTILYYTKNDHRTWNQQYQPLNQQYVEANYRYSDEQGRYSTMPLRGGGVRGQTYTFTWKGIHSTDWRFPRDSLDRLENEGLIHWSRQGLPRRKMYLKDSKGVAARDVVTDVSRATRSERTGYPTQKPIALYERFIKASSNPDDIVLDPFAGCATTPVAAERLGRQWVGIDIWDGAHEIVLKRLNREFLDVPEVSSGRLFSLGGVTYSKVPPKRTDNRIEAAPDLVLRETQRVPKYQQLTHDRMKSYLADAQRNWRGRVICAGCGRGYDIRMMHLDHKTPRSEGGVDYITNRLLLCGYCNGRKGSRLRLAGLRQRNIDDGWMDNERRARDAEERAAQMARDVRDEIGR